MELSSFFLSIARGLYPARLHYSIYYNAVSATGNWVNNSIGFIFFILALTSLGILTYPIYKFLIMFTQEYSENLSRILIILAKISSLSLIMVGIFLDTTDPNYKWMAKVHGLFAITYFISTSSFFICLGIFQIENHDEMRKTHESHILNVLILFFLTVFFAGMIGMFFSFLNLDYHTHIQIYLCTFQHWSFWEWHFILAHVILMPLTSMKLKNLQDSTKIFS